MSGSLIYVTRAIKWRSSLATEDRDKMNESQNTQSVGFRMPFTFPAYCAANPLKQKQERSYEYILYRNYIVLDFFYVLLTVHLSIILETDQLNAQIIVL